MNSKIRAHWILTLSVHILSYSSQKTFYRQTWITSYSRYSNVLYFELIVNWLRKNFELLEYFSRYNFLSKVLNSWFLLDFTEKFLNYSRQIFSDLLFNCLCDNDVKVYLSWILCAFIKNPLLLRIQRLTLTWVCNYERWEKTDRTNKI